MVKMRAIRKRLYPVQSVYAIFAHDDECDLVHEFWGQTFLNPPPGTDQVAGAWWS